MKLLINLLISTLAIYVTAKIIPGIFLKDVTTAVFVSIVFGALNMVVKPILNILAFPVNLLTLGLFSLVINALMVILTSYIVPGFGVYTFLSAVFFSVAVSIINSFLSALTK